MKRRSVLLGLLSAPLSLFFGSKRAFANTNVGYIKVSGGRWRTRSEERELAKIVGWKNVPMLSERVDVIVLNKNGHVPKDVFDSHDYIFRVIGRVNDKGVAYGSVTPIKSLKKGHISFGPESGNRIAAFCDIPRTHWPNVMFFMGVN